MSVVLLLLLTKKSNF